MPLKMSPMMSFPSRKIRERDIAYEIRGLRKDIREIEEQRQRESETISSKSPYIKDQLGLNPIPFHRSNEESEWRNETIEKDTVLSIDNHTLKKLNII